jgi:hypothetical protein
VANGRVQLVEAVEQVGLARLLECANGWLLGAHRVRHLAPPGKGPARAAARVT